MALLKELDPHPLPSFCLAGPGWALWGAVGCLEYHGAQTHAGCQAPRCQQWKAPEPCGEDDAEMLQDGAEPPRPWQMLIPGSVSGSRQSPRPRRPPLPGDPREPHPSAWPTRLQRPPGSRGPARGTHAALWSRTPVMGGSHWLGGRSAGAESGQDGDGAHTTGTQLEVPPGPTSTQGGSEGVLETQACSTLALRVGFTIASWQPGLAPQPSPALLH